MAADALAPGVASTSAVMILIMWAKRVLVFINYTINNMATDDVVMQVASSSVAMVSIYRKTSNIRRTLLGNEIVNRSIVVGAAPAGAAPTTPPFST